MGGVATESGAGPRRALLGENYNLAFGLLLPVEGDEEAAIRGRKGGSRRPSP